MKPQGDLQSKAVSRPGGVRELDPVTDDGSAGAGSGLGVRRPHLAVRLARLALQIALPAAILAGALAIYTHLKATKPEIAKRGPREASFAVRAVPVEIGTVLPTLTLYGTTTAGRQVELRSLVAGRVIETGSGLRDGAEVEKGAMLLRIDPFDFELKVKETKAQHAEAKAKLVEMQASLVTEEGNLGFARQQLALARTDLGRAMPLAQRGTVSAQTVDNRRLIVFQRQQAVTLAENTIAVWKARIEQQKAVIDRLATAIAQAEKRLEETALRAPFHAYVTGPGAQVGRMLGVNDPVATLIDRDWIEVRFTLANEQFGRIVGGSEQLIGRPVSLSWHVGTRTLQYDAKIERIGARVTANTGGIDVYARLETPRSPVPIRPGVFVTITVKDARFENVARIPSTAVYDNARVYVIKDGRLKGRAVTVLGTAGSHVLVSGELKAGERVVTTRLSTPGDGVRVEELNADGA